LKGGWNEQYFEFGKAELKKSELFPELGTVLPHFSNLIPNYFEQWHTDNLGTEFGEQINSQEGMDVVRNYLLTSVPAERLSAKGYGKIKPKVANDTAIKQLTVE
jgi:hypothetical protein